MRATCLNWRGRQSAMVLLSELVFLVITSVALQKLINQGLFAGVTLRYNPDAFLSAEAA